MRSLTLRDPFRSVFDSFFTDTLPELFAGENPPRTNIAETDKALVLSFELPGLDEQDIDVQIEDRTLTVLAERKEEARDEGTTWHRVEHRYGKLSRSILLPDSVRSDGVEAVYRRGILTVTVQKRPESQPTKVQIKA
jgi:HSP20 family protein